MTALITTLLYVSTLVLVVGVVAKVHRYATVPAPLKIPTTPAPTTVPGVVWRMAKEVVFFESLFKASKWTWVLGWMFHASLLVVLLGHLRYFTQPVWFWVELLQPFGKFASFSMVAGLAGLWFRRIAVDRVRYISNLSDHLMLVLLISIGLSGMAMRFVIPTDIIMLKAFALGLLSLQWLPLPSDPLLWLHLLLVATLLLIFPFSKLLHAPGLFFSPTRNQVDNAREKRHITKWAVK